MTWCDAVALDKLVLKRIFAVCPQIYLLPSLFHSRKCVLVVSGWGRWSGEESHFSVMLSIDLCPLHPIHVLKFLPP